MRSLFRRLRFLFRRDPFIDDLNEEIRLHLELRTRQLTRLGIAREEAGYMALRQFGNRTLVQDSSTAMWGWGAWERLFQDFRLGFRTLAKSPGFTAVAVLTLAIGLGINTAVFSLVNAVMIRPLPYPEPTRLVSLWEETSRNLPRRFSSSGSNVGSAGKPERTTVSVANLAGYRQCAALADVASYSVTPMNLTGEGLPERIQGESVTWNFFRVLSVEPALGRAFVPDDDRTGASRVVILTQYFWQRRLGGDTAVLGRTILLDGRPYSVIGVLPGTFESPAQFGSREPMEFYIPAAYPAGLLASHGDHTVSAVARLRQGATRMAAQSELDSISAALAGQFPDSNRGVRAVTGPLRDDLVRGVRDPLLAITVAAGLIVLITCVNVANLLLVRAVARRRECSVRLALGASRLRMLRQFLAESMVLAASGCAAGILLGRILMQFLTSIAPPSIPQIAGVSMDWRVFVVSAIVATVTGIAFGLAPAWQASQSRPVDALRSSSRLTGGKSQTRWRTSLTVAEIALSLILMVGAGLLLKSFLLLMSVDLGFQPDRVLVMGLNLPDVRFPDATRRLQFFEQLESRVRNLPGVQSVAYANRLPLRGGWGGSVVVDTAPDSSVESDLQAVSPGYFPTLGISLVRGRLFTSRDGQGNQPVAVVNQAFARQFLGGVDPIGRRLARSKDRPWCTIVGVVADIRREGKTGSVTPQAYFAAAQTSQYAVRLADFAVRTSSDPRQLVKAIQSEVWTLHKDQPINSVRTLEEIIDASVAQRRFQTLLLVIFAAVAVGLAVIGIFGVLSYSVNQRISELGIRMALGARPRSILVLVLKEAGALAGVGIALGLGGAFALTRYLGSMLFGVQPTDTRTYFVAVALLAAAALAAAFLPARRASRVEPVVALRYE